MKYTEIYFIPFSLCCYTFSTIFFHRQFKQIGTKNKLQVMNLILATHAKPVLAHKAPTICPTFLYQSIQASALPQPYPIAHVNALQGKI